MSNYVYTVIDTETVKPTQAIEGVFKQKYVAKSYLEKVLKEGASIEFFVVQVHYVTHWGCEFVREVSADVLLGEKR